MSAKSKKVQLDEDFIDLNSKKSLLLYGEKNRAFGMTSSLCLETKIKKTKAWK